MSARLAFRYSLLEHSLDDRMKRLWAASEALAIGKGGVTIVSQVTSLPPGTIRAGIRDLQSSAGDLGGPLGEVGRLRRRGAGRKPLWMHNEGLEDDLRSLLESSHECPRGPLEWTSKSTRRLARELSEIGHQISYRTVATMLSKQGFKFPPMRTGYRRVDPEKRRAQFAYLSRLVQQALDREQPVLSIAIKHGVAPSPHRRHSLRPLPPDHELALLTVAYVRMWWRTEGRRRFPRASSMALISDSSGTLHADREMWRCALLAGGSGELHFSVSHLPPGSIRWKRTEPVGWVQTTLPEPLDQHRRIRIVIELIRRHDGRASQEGPADRSADQLPDFLKEWNYFVARGVGSESD